MIVLFSVQKATTGWNSNLYYVYIIKKEFIYKIERRGRERKRQREEREREEIEKRKRKRDRGKRRKKRERRGRRERENNGLSNKIVILTKKLVEVDITGSVSLLSPLLF